MIQFYAPDILTNPTLPEGESAHCCRVLRMREGDEVWIVDGRGHRYKGVLTEAHPKHTSVNIIESIEVPNHWKQHITLAIAPTKNADRIEWVIEKCVEIGIDKIVLLKCEHSERKRINIDRLDNIVISAMKQSLKGVKPQLCDLMPIREFLNLDIQGQKLVGYCDERIERRTLKDVYIPGTDATIVIGPEGDFSPSEIELALARGFEAVTFGESRMRTETAALYGVTAIHVLNAH